MRPKVVEESDQALRPRVFSTLESELGLGQRFDTTMHLFDLDLSKICVRVVGRYRMLGKIILVSGRVGVHYWAFISYCAARCLKF